MDTVGMIEPDASQWGEGYETGRQQERRRIAEMLRRDAETIESFAAPGKAVLLAAHLIASTSPDSRTEEQS
jgi:hypothetical protein